MWENPWLGSGPRFGLGLDLLYRDYLYVYDDAGPQFEDADIERFSTQLRLFYDPGGPVRLTTAVGLESVHSPVAGVTVQDDRDTYASFGVTFRYDSRTDRLYPFNGLYFEAKAEEIGLGNRQITVHEAFFDLRAFKSIGGRGILASQGRLRYRDGDNIPIYHREHLGGSLTLRGYEFGTFHGASSVITSLEGRLPINFSQHQPAGETLLGFAWHLFADAGMAWDDNKDLAIHNFHGGFGVGCFFSSHTGHGIRFDYGWRLDDPGRFYVEIDMKF
jgi:outer membrane protein assembly factor BamA